MEVEEASKVSSERLKEGVRAFKGLAELGRTSILDTVIDGVDSLVRTASDLAFGRRPTALVDLWTVHDDRTLVSRGSALLTVIEIDGCGSAVGEDEFVLRIEALNELIRPRLQRDSGHSFKVIFESDPDNIRDELGRRLAGARVQARSMGLDVEDLIDEKIEANAQFCHRERVWLCFYTHPNIMSKSERSLAVRKHVKSIRRLPGVGDSQPLVSYLPTIAKAHSSSIDSFMDGLQHAGLHSHIVSSDNALRNIVYSLEGPEVARGWMPESLAWGDDALAREQRLTALTSSKMSRTESREYRRYLGLATEDNNKSLEPILPRSLPEQLVGGDFMTAGNYVVTRNRFYAPIHVTRHCYSPVDFDQLISSMRGTPFRVSFTLTAAGLTGDFLNSQLTDLFRWIPPTNRQIARAREQLREYEEVYSGSVPGFSIVATTWAPLKELVDSETGNIAYQTEDIQTNTNKLLAALTDWGGTHAAATTADPLEALFATIPGLVCGHVTRPVPAPLHDILQMLPISRMRMVWDRGAVLYRTVDGTPMSYEQFSSEQNAWVTLLIGPMGMGKSSHMNSLNLAFLIQSAETPQLPYLRGIDFGYSGQGVVELVRSGLPEHEKHRARYIRMENHERYSTNVFDTARGCRFPIPSHTTFLSNFLQSAANSLRDYRSLPGLCDLVIKEAYKRYTDDNHNTGAKRYSRGTNTDIDLILEKHGISASDGETTWWSLVDHLFQLGEEHMAGIAQRYAVPTLEDLVGIATSPTVTSEYGEEFSGRPVTEMFARALRETIDSLPFLRSVTQFDISDSEIILLDLAGMIPSGTAMSDQQKVKAAIVYLSAMRILTGDFFLGLDDLQFFDKRYLAYHENRLKHLATLKKRFFIDERHRIKGVAAAEAQTDQMIVEGRKYFVDVMQGSQYFDDFSKKVQNLATTIVLCGSGSREVTEQIAQHYDLTSTQKRILSDLRGPVSGQGAPALFCFKSKKAGTQYFHLINTEGPLMLCSVATEAPDRYVRDQLYRRCITTHDARRRFAAMFPGGTVKAELKRRQELAEDGLYQSKSGNILDDILMELVT